MSENSKPTSIGLNTQKTCSNEIIHDVTPETFTGDPAETDELIAISFSKKLFNVNSSESQRSAENSIHTDPAVGLSGRNCRKFSTNLTRHKASGTGKSPLVCPK